jgi:chromosomal replication initiation ATPase DnaA
MEEAQELKPHEITIEMIENACCEVFGVKQKEIRDKSNLTQRVCWARHCIWLLMRKVKWMTFEAIGIDFDAGKSTIQKGTISANEIIKDNSFVREAFAEIGTRIRSRTIVDGIISNLTVAA